MAESVPGRVPPSAGRANSSGPAPWVLALGQGFLAAAKGQGVDLSRHTGMDCRYPEAKDGNANHIPVSWVPAIHAGTTRNAIMQQRWEMQVC